LKRTTDGVLTQVQTLEENINKNPPQLFAEIVQQSVQTNLLKVAHSDKKRKKENDAIFNTHFLSSSSRTEQSASTEESM
jgi:hypothetical protein